MRTSFLLKILELVKNYNLGKMIRWVLEHNTAQALPYHNFTHSLWVMMNAAILYTCETERAAPKSLIVAALFHDFDHTGGFAKDAQNIARPFSDFDFAVHEDSLSDWQKVEGCLWSAMDQFESAYGDSEVATLGRQPTSAEVLARFKRIVREYDQPCVLVRCANCKTERKVSKFQVQDGSVRCKCGGYCVTMAKLLRGQNEH